MCARACVCVCVFIFSLYRFCVVVVIKTESLPPFVSSHSFDCELCVHNHRNISYNCVYFQIHFYTYASMFASQGVSYCACIYLILSLTFVRSHLFAHFVHTDMSGSNHYCGIIFSLSYHRYRAVFYTFSWLFLCLLFIY